MNSENTAASLYKRLLSAALLLAFVVVVLGAWVRLTDAGLGCPDWPGCYGGLTVPDSAAEIARAEASFPERPVETGKAWREMIHRYAASFLGVLIVAIAALAFVNRRDPAQPVILPIILLGLVICQGLLGMLTVTLLLKPLIVLGHLLGGMTTIGLLLWLRLRVYRPQPREHSSVRGLRGFALFCLVALGVQIALGGWTSTNYAALACPDFPTCQTRWWPDMDAREGFILWRGLGIDYEGGVLDNPARTAIHFVHRLGALAVSILLLALIMAGIRSRERDIVAASVLTGAALFTQLALGISIVVKSLPLGLATAHNAIAALLLLALINLNQALRYARH